MAPRDGRWLMGIAALLLALTVGLRDAQAAEAATAQHWQVLEKYCAECHNATDWAGGVAFDTLTTDPLAANAKVWEGTVRKLRGRLMPPPGKPQLDAATRTTLVGWLESSLDAATETHADPGHIVLHRLNRSEYANEIERLLDLRIEVSELLPRDTESEGFYNVASALTVSPTFFEQYIAAARQISIQAVGESAPKLSHEVHAASEFTSQTSHVHGTPLGTRGGMAVEHQFPADGTYEFNLNVSSKSGHALRSYWLEYPHTLVMSIDGKPVFEASLGGEKDQTAVDQQQTAAAEAILDRFRKIRLPVRAGPRKIGVAWLAKSFAESDAELQPLVPGEGEERIPHLKSIDVLGPSEIAGIGETPSRRRIFTCRPANEAEELPCARRILLDLSRQAFRRPVTDAEGEVILGFYREGRRTADFETGVQKALMAILSSPKFLYRAETAPQAAAGTVYAINDLELASRLAFFLWSRGPDEELLQLAQAGALGDPATLERQTRRMLADPRSGALVSNFAMQWLRMGGLDAIDPDPKLFPNFDEELRHAFQQEIELFVNSVLRGERSVVDLLTADHTFVNERLARHYGIQNVRGDQFRRVRLEDANRWGLLGKGSVLMASSYPDRTSPVLRGAWMLEALIGAPPAAPPPGVETALAAPAGAKATTVRALLEEHRQAASCNQCHGVIDPLGLALENFDTIGEWQSRDRYAGTPIDASGTLAGGGATIQGPADLRRALAADPVQFVQTLTEKLLTYALGRTVEYHDMPTVRAIVRDSARDDYRFSSIVGKVVASDAFRKSRLPVPDAQQVNHVR